MTTGLNVWSDVSSIAMVIQEDAEFVVRETGTMLGLVKTFTDMRGSNARKGYVYTQGTAVSPAETDDLTAYKFTPELVPTLTPAEIALLFFVSDQRRDSESPESIIVDGARELGLAASDKINTDLIGDLASLTGGTIGAAGTAITWGYLAAAIAVARNANKSTAIPLSVVLHGYQWAVLAKAASVAGATVAVAPGFQEEVTRSGKVADFMGASLYQVFAAADTNSDFTGGVFPQNALAMDWRRPVRVEPQRDASRRGEEFNMSAVYAHGVWRAALGVKFIFDATAPSS